MPTHKRLRLRHYGLIAITLLVIGFFIAEAVWWPFLAGPLEKQLTQTLNRKVSLTQGDFKLRFLGGIKVHVAQLVVAPPPWSTATSMLEATRVELNLNYADLWNAYQGQRLSVASLQAASLDTNLERSASGQVSWQLRNSGTPPAIPLFNLLEVPKGTLKFSDAQLQLMVESEFSASAINKTFNINGTGSFKKLPLKFAILTSNILPWESAETAAARVGLKINATVGRVTLAFNGTALNATSINDFGGNYTIKGPSLAALGDPIGVTLPTTSAFVSDGIIVRSTADWSVIAKTLNIGASRLSGAFKFTEKNASRNLSGRLSGTKLNLIDLAPTIGGSTNGIRNNAKGKVLPNRPFDLASLRAMDANILIDIKEVDLNTTRLEPLRPLQAHLQLTSGVLTISSIQANTAQGNVRGQLALDGRGQEAIWTARLQISGVRLEQWLKLSKRESLPPYISGQLNGLVNLRGEGRSTAEILASLQGKVAAQIKNGSISHLLIEAAGLDIAQAIGVTIIGDDALKMTCAVADLTVDKGVFRPRLMVIDTKDSALWVAGQVSLAKEILDLKAVVAPRDFSPLTLRTPILVSGSFSTPKFSVDKNKIGIKIGSALLLALVNPLAALLPFIDAGDTQAADNAILGCKNLSIKATGR